MEGDPCVVDFPSVLSAVVPQEKVDENRVDNGAVFFLDGFANQLQDGGTETRNVAVNMKGLQGWRRGKEREGGDEKYQIVTSK